MNRRILNPLVIVGLMSLGQIAQGDSGGGQGLERYHYAQIRMGVQVRIVLYAPDRETAEGACTAAFARLGELEAIASDYRIDSELNRLCAQSGKAPVPVSDDLLHILTLSQTLSARTGGVFDVTVGPYVRLWREARGAEELPTAEALAEARGRVGWEKVRIDEEAGTVQLLAEGMQLDLGGIAKGYGLDEALAALGEHGIRSTLLAAGGDIVLGDAPPGTDGWRIEVANARRKKRMVTLANAAISSSGDTEQYVEIGGKRYSHIVDPRTGLGLTSRVAATVIAADGRTSDSLATAACVLGRKQGMRLIRSQPGAKGYIRKAVEKRGGGC